MSDGTYLAIIAGCAFAAGVLTTSMVFVMLRDVLIERALDRREHEVYGPLLERVERVEARDAARQIRKFQPATDVKARRPAAAIRLDAFPLPPRRRAARRR